jgi:hypothetical protein
MKRREMIAVLAVLMLLVAVCAAYAHDSSQAVPYRIGIGLGIPYGALGVNAEMNRDNKFTPTLGLGLCAGGVGWCAGGRYYLKDSTNGKHQGYRFTLGYGVTALLDDGDTWSTETGIVLGFGTQGKNWNVDLIYAQMPTTPAGFTRQGGSIGLSFGYMFK